MRPSPYEFLQAHDGIALRYGVWPCQSDTSRGTVVVLGGRSEFMEKYLVTIEALNLRGLDVFSFDWRGQGLSGRMLGDDRKGHIDTYAQYISDLDWLLDQIVLPQSRPPLMILAHSMGAHIVLRYLAKFSPKVDKAALTGPMIRINFSPLAEVVIRYASRIMIRTANADVGLPAVLHRDAFGRPFRYNRLTSDAQRFYAIRRMLNDNPRLDSSNLTFGWMDATFASIDELQARGCAEAITTPILIVMAGQDRVVCNQAIFRFAHRLPRHRLLTVQGALHEILQERKHYRRQFWEAFDAFI